MQKPELLCPAGSLEKLQYALAYGADAVYAGLPILSLRARENEFDFDKVEQGIKFAHEHGKKVYLTANIFAHNIKIKVFTQALERIAKWKPDALIMSDPGLIAIAKENHPEIPIHLSVQANVMNWSGVKFWQKVGVSRIILSRELRLNEIKAIKDNVPDMELEAFVHGSLCIAYSGRCLLSTYFSRRDANQGACDNSCRYPMKIHQADQAKDPSYFIEDERNAGEFFRIDEDEHGTYIMNSKDLCLIEHLKEIIDAGVCSLKVEGRTKSLHYVCVVSRAYRQAIDDLMAGRPFNPSLLNDLRPLSYRGYSTGFMLHGPSAETQAYEHVSESHQSPFVGVIQPSDTGRVRVEVKGQLHNKARYQLYTPTRATEVEIEGLRKLDGSPLDVAHPGVGTVELTLPEQVEPYSLLRRLP